MKRETTKTISIKPGTSTNTVTRTARPRQFDEAKTTTRHPKSGK